MKKDLMKKIVDTVCNTMFISSHDVEKICVDLDRPFKCGLTTSISNCLKYVEMRRFGDSEDIVISYSEYANAIIIYTTSHRDGLCKGYSYEYCVTTEKKNQIEVTAELCKVLHMAITMVRGK